jgi:hypothetical protein
MYTALGIYESISRVLPGSGRLLARSMENGVEMVNAVFCGAAPAAFAVTVQRSGTPLVYAEPALTAHISLDHYKFASTAPTAPAAYGQHYQRRDQGTAQCGVLP